MSFTPYLNLLPSVIPMDINELKILIGKNITRIRKKKGLTIKELGFQCDIEKSNLIPIEKGRVNVTIETLNKIANALNIKIEELFKELNKNDVG